MPTELEELVEFLHHGNTQIRQIGILNTAAALRDIRLKRTLKAIENLVGYSQADPSIFKTGQLTPIKDLKLLVKDYPPLAKNVLTILINLSEDKEVLQSLATDDGFLETLLAKVTNEKESNANEICMLLANMAKKDEMKRILKLKRSVPKGLSTSEFAIDQLMDCFVKGAEGKYNKQADFDYLSYFFADLSKFPECRDYFIQPQTRDDGIVPLTKLVVFTEHASDVRRRGVASTIKNVSFDLKSHSSLLDVDGVNVLPYILLPIMGPEEYSDEDSDGMLEDLQLLPPDKQREKDNEIIKTHLETLLLLTTEREGREVLRRVKVYPIVRETHSRVDDEGVREACDRVVQVIMRDEEGEGEDGLPEGVPNIRSIEAPEDDDNADDDDDDDKVVDII